MQRRARLLQESGAGRVGLRRHERQAAVFQVVLQRLLGLGPQLERPGAPDEQDGQGKHVLRRQVPADRREGEGDAALLPYQGNGLCQKPRGARLVRPDAFARDGLPDAVGKKEHRARGGVKDLVKRVVPGPRYPLRLPQRAPRAVTVILPPQLAFFRPAEQRVGPGPIGRHGRPTHDAVLAVQPRPETGRNERRQGVEPSPRAIGVLCLEQLVRKTLPEVSAVFPRALELAVHAHKKEVAIVGRDTCAQSVGLETRLDQALGQCSGAGRAAPRIRPELRQQPVQANGMPRAEQGGVPLPRAHAGPGRRQAGESGRLDRYTWHACHCVEVPDGLVSVHLVPAAVGMLRACERSRRSGQHDIPLFRGQYRPLVHRRPVGLFGEQALIGRDSQRPQRHRRALDVRRRLGEHVVRQADQRHGIVIVGRQVDPVVDLREGRTRDGDLPEDVLLKRKQRRLGLVEFLASGEGVPFLDPQLLLLTYFAQNLLILQRRGQQPGVDAHRTPQSFGLAAGDLPVEQLAGQRLDKASVVIIRHRGERRRHAGQVPRGVGRAVPLDEVGQVLRKA